jgi:hypothetical protein
MERKWAAGDQRAAYREGPFLNLSARMATFGVTKDLFHPDAIGFPLMKSRIPSRLPSALPGIKTP